VVSALLLNYVELAPGQALYLPAGNLHAYLRGVGIEIMASSDNVLRGGLTSKHVDVPELLRVLDFSPFAVAPLSPEPHGAEEVWNSPAAEFRLSRVRLEPGASFPAKVRGPEILLVTDGHAHVEARDGKRVELARGASAFVSAADESYELRGTASVFRASVPLP
jgi:mannose-6-phosphate isomerase